MTEEKLMFLYSIGISAFNNIQFILAMLLVIVVAACFLGRYVVLSRKLVFASFGVMLIPVIATIALNIIFSEQPDNDTIYVIETVINVVLFGYAFVFFLLAFKEKRLFRAIESTICLYLVAVYINTFSQLAVIYFAGGDEEVFNKIYNDNFATGPHWLVISLMSVLITLILFLIGYFGFYRQKKYYSLGIPYRILFVVWTIVFVVTPFFPAVMSGDDVYPMDRYHTMSVLFAAMIVILGLAVPVILVVIFAERAMQEKNKAQASYLEAELEYIGQYKRQQVETKAFRHDIKNNLAMIQMMLEQGHTEEAKAHIGDMLGNVSALSPKYVTGDEMLDIIIFMKADKMAEKNIRFTLDGVVDGGLNIKPMDMCSIFANALDNAIEAASVCKDPFVSFSIKRTDRFFVLKITNSAAGKVDAGKLLSTSGYTSKKDKDHHGFGLMNVRRAIEDCNGILKAESDESSFILSIMMPREQ